MNISIAPKKDYKLLFTLIFMIALPIVVACFYYADIKTRQSRFFQTKNSEIELLNVSNQLVQSLQAQNANLWLAVNYGPESQERQKYINNFQKQWESALNQTQIFKTVKVRIEDNRLLDEINTSLPKIKYSIDKILNSLNTNDKKLINDSKVMMISELSMQMENLILKIQNYQDIQRTRVNYQLEKESSYNEDQLFNLLFFTLALIVIALFGWYLIKREYKKLSKTIVDSDIKVQKLKEEMELDAKTLSQLVLIDQSQEVSIEEVYSQLQSLREQGQNLKESNQQICRELDGIKELSLDIVDLSKSLVLIAKEGSGLPLKVNESLVFNLNMANQTDKLQNVLFQTQLLLFSTRVELGEGKNSKKYLTHVMYELEKIMKMGDEILKELSLNISNSNSHQSSMLINVANNRDNFKSALLLLAKELNDINAKIETTKLNAETNQSISNKHSKTIDGLTDYFNVVRAVDTEAHKGLRQLNSRRKLNLENFNNEI